MGSIIIGENEVYTGGTSMTKRKLSCRVHPSHVGTHSSILFFRGEMWQEGERLTVGSVRHREM
jgi:hypothetical protein